MNIVIIGDGKIGSSLTSQLLKEEHNIVLIDNNADALRHSIDTQDVMCVEGNGASYSVQKEAGVDTADVVIACTSMDELNMLCCLLGKKLGAKKTIARVRNPEYYYQMDLMKEELGLSMAINPEYAAAQEISRVLIFPAATQVEVFAKGRVELVGFKISAESPLAGLSLAQVYSQSKIKLLVCAVQRGEDVFIPGGDFVLTAGDLIHVAATHQEMERFFQSSGQKQKIKTVMIIGGGRIGYYLAKKLDSLGMRVKIIEKDYDKCLKLNELLPKTTVVHGDGTDQDTLVEEGIADMDAVCSLLGIDEENIIVSMFASGVNVPKIVTKVNRDSYAEMAQNLGLDTIISPKDIAASGIVSYVRALTNSYGSSSVETMYRLLDGKVEALGFAIREKSEYLDVPLRDLKLKRGVLIASIVRDRKLIIPDGNESLRLGDSVVVVTTNERISDLGEILA